GRANIVLDWTHVCRVKGCTHKEVVQDAEPRRCPTHAHLLWPKPRVRPIRFYDLRHTTATLLLKAGVPLATVQRVLRHSDPNLTAGTYGHLDLDDVRSGLD